MKRYQCVVIGAGPAGLSAAIEAKKAGMSVVVFDENLQPGGQLIKQIHKFFGSREQKAKERGFVIGKELLDEAHELNVDVKLNTVIKAINYPMKRVTAVEGDHITSYSADNIIIAAGASEATLPFKGWTLPGVIGAGAAQTLMNLHGIQPGDRVLMVGSGNVGLVVAFQLLQAGCEVVAVIDALPHIGGYGVHASKLARTGVPFYTSHTIIEAEGADRVTGAVIAEVDNSFKPIAGTEKHFDVDTICIAVGLTPSSKLADMTGCEMTDIGGAVPIVNQYGMTSIEGLYAAGDTCGISEASSAMITGRIAAIAAAHKDGFIPDDEFETKYKLLDDSRRQIDSGMFCKANKGKAIEVTDEGIEISHKLLEKGYLAENEIYKFPGAIKKAKGLHPVIECTQNIPCNPCQDVCHFGCIAVGDIITALPSVCAPEKCEGCGMCVAHCPGQAIFLVNEQFEPGYASITIPYEFLPMPQSGDHGLALDRSGKTVCETEIVDVKTNNIFNKTAIITIKVPIEAAGKARFYKGAMNTNE